MKDPLIVSTAQFENRSGDKEYNLSVIDALSAKASEQGSDVIAFHECSITGYTFARHLSKIEMLEVAELIPDGDSIKKLTEIARKNKIVILAGLFEKDSSDNLFKAYVCVDRNGVIAKFRKLHPFINPHLTPGNEYCVFEL
ncbi:MAG TPA: nitrilase-related carbon-nitrogen hydrolase, partial [Chryseolinea sp.]|nr:nitrilase-related carbon-nitrogen hydrolase [Chryseolinea sp.]